MSNEITKKIATSKERLLQFIESKGVTKSEFYKKTGLKRGILDHDKLKSSISDKFLANIIASYPEINPEWLITGKGPMLRQEAEKSKEKQPELLPAEPGKGIPLVSIAANAGHGSFDSLITARDVKEYYVVPKWRFTPVDFLIEISGNSMAPKYYPGDLIAVHKLSDPRYIQWNRPYLIGTRDQGLLVKRIHQSDKPDHFRLVSDNPAYQPFDIPKDEITGLALVVGVIRSE